MSVTIKESTSRTSGAWFVSLLSLAAGIILIAFYGNDQILNRIVQLIGILVGLVGLTMTVYQLMLKPYQRVTAYIASGIVLLLLGLWLIFDSSFFISFVIYELATMLILMGVWHIITIKLFGKVMEAPYWVWIIPALLIVGGLAIFFTGARVTFSAIVLITGILLVLSAFNVLLNAVAGRREVTRSEIEVIRNDNDVPERSKENSRDSDAE